jgi:hypothetical protein
MKVPFYSYLVCGLFLLGCSSSSPSKPAKNDLYIERHIITTLAGRDLSGKTFTLENAESVLNNSSEYREYAKQISSFLVAAGMREIEKSRTARPDFEAVYKYADSISNSNVRAKAPSSRSRKFFGFGSNSDNNSNTSNSRQSDNGVVYHSELELKLYQPLPLSESQDSLSATLAAEKRKVLYESVSFGSSNDSNQRHVIPELIKFQLGNFPGSLGETSRTTVQLNNGN